MYLSNTPTSHPTPKTSTYLTAGTLIEVSHAHIPSVVQHHPLASGRTCPQSDCLICCGQCWCGNPVGNMAQGWLQTVGLLILLWILARDLRQWICGNWLWLVGSSRYMYQKYPWCIHVSTVSILGARYLPPQIQLCFQVRAFAFTFLNSSKYYSLTLLLLNGWFKNCSLV